MNVEYLDRAWVESVECQEPYGEAMRQRKRGAPYRFGWWEVVLSLGEELMLMLG